MNITVPGLLANGLEFSSSGFQILYAVIAAFMWLMTTLFSREYMEHYPRHLRYYFFCALTFAATVGVFLSGDLFTTFVFFEIMSFTSYVMVVHDESSGAMRAGQTYMAVAVLGGMVMLMGLFLLRRLCGTLRIADLRDACASLAPYMRPQLYLAGAFILFGFGAKAGMYPLHIWLPKAHPVAPAPASALLSGILTKAGIFGILVLSCKIFLHDAAWGMAILILGVLTMVTGAVIALFSINLKRTLACSSVSQIGFILVGVGMQGLLGEHNTLAVWGTELHMVNHSLIKLVLFMAAGAIYMKLHSLDLNDLRGYGRGKPLLTFIFLTGYLGIAGIPLFNGYISKTLLHESIVEYIELLEEAGKSIVFMKSIEWLFLFSGGLTVAYMTKLFVAIFVEKNPSTELAGKHASLNGRCMSPLSAFALTLPALVLPVLGFFPSATMQRLAELGQGFMGGRSPEHAVAWFSLTNLKGAAISVGIGLLVYFFFIRAFLMEKRDDGCSYYVNRWPDKLDIEDSIYRPLCALLAKLCTGVSSIFSWLGDVGFPTFAHFTALLISGIAASVSDWVVTALRKTLLRQRPIPKRNPDDYLPADLSVDFDVSPSASEILSGFSWGLLLFGLGLCVIMIYILLK